ncbi:glycosyltransferase [Chryseotalea sanaruensis]|nr:glycosyltransferase [Chryseotalea sanaruensis]
MKRILFYTSIRTRVRDQESLMVEFVKKGHQVFFINQQQNDYLPTICKQAGVIYKRVSIPKLKSSIVRTFFYSIQLAKFVWLNKIDIVYSHLEPANFIAVLAQYLIRAKVIIVRHHHDLAALAGFSNDLSYKLTYRLANHVIVVAKATKEYMILKEGINRSKIVHINLGYDFNLFTPVDDSRVSQLRSQLQGAIGLITVGRLEPNKRPELSLEVLKRLTDRGIQASLKYLGAGEMKTDLEQLVNLYGLTNQVEFLGYRDDVLDQLKGSDWLLHPSISEASCVVIKEAGLVKLPVIACKGIGDFDDYLVHEENSMLVHPDTFLMEACEIIAQHTNQKIRNQLGAALNQSIIEKFHISSVLNQYDYFNVD